MEEERHWARVGASEHGYAATGDRGGGNKFIPWSHMDLSALVDVQPLGPPIREGAGPWIRKLETHTAGQKLCIGDARAVLARCLGVPGSDAVDRAAGTHKEPDRDPFDPVRNSWWDTCKANILPMGQGWA